MILLLKTPFYRLIAFALKIAGHIIPQPMPLLFSGSHSSLQLAKHIARSETQRVLLVTDNIIHDLGLCNAFCHELTAAGIAVHVFDRVEPDPADSLIKQGIEQFHQHQCDTVVGFGGGSALDAAKLIAIMADSPQPLPKIVGILKIRQSGRPFYLLPTTSGTGSEVTMAAVMTVSSTGQKGAVVDPKLLPLAVALDPTLMTGMPQAVTAMTGMDALTHGIEAYISRNASEGTSRYALMAIQLIFEFLPRAWKTGDDLEAREAMALAASYAGLAFTKAGLGYVHGIAHQLGAIYHIPHGLANAYVLPHVLTFSEPSVRLKFKQLAEAIGLDVVGKSDKDASQAFIQAVSELKQQLALPEHCPELKQSDIDKIVNDALKEAHFLHPVPRYLSPAACRSLVEKMLPQS